MAVTRARGRRANRGAVRCAAVCGGVRCGVQVRQRVARVCKRVQSLGQVSTHYVLTCSRGHLWCCCRCRPSPGPFVLVGTFVLVHVLAWCDGPPHLTPWRCGFGRAVRHRAGQGRVAAGRLAGAGARRPGLRHPRLVARRAPLGVRAPSLPPSLSSPCPFSAHVLLPLPRGCPALHLTSLPPLPAQGTSPLRRRSSRWARPAPSTAAASSWPSRTRASPRSLPPPTPARRFASTTRGATALSLARARAASATPRSGGTPLPGWQVAFLGGAGKPPPWGPRLLAWPAAVPVCCARVRWNTALVLHVCMRARGSCVWVPAFVAFHTCTCACLPGVPPP